MSNERVEDMDERNVGGRTVGRDVVGRDADGRRVDRREAGRDDDDRNIDNRNPEDTTASRLFDLRTIIGALFVLYGVILVIAGLFDTDAEIARSNGIRINLWLGAAMFVLGALFLLWVRLRPLHISKGPSAAEQAGITDGPPGA